MTDENLPAGGGEPNTGPRGEPSAEPTLALRTPASRGPVNPKRKRSLMFHMGRGMAWLVGGALTLVVLVVGGFWWYSTTGDFQRRVGREIVSVLEDATGGRVEVARGPVQPVEPGD